MTARNADQASEKEAGLADARTKLTRKKGGETAKEDETKDKLGVAAGTRLEKTAAGNANRKPVRCRPLPISLCRTDRHEGMSEMKS